ncbi:MAG: hemerythrin domain-containing protein [Terracidiphilus sp.]|jgi:hemerythrin-like domain-containing protein
MAIQIGAIPDSGFDDPIRMLADCHRRVEGFFGILCVVVERAQNRELTEEEKSAVQSALHYFKVGGQRHTADEEESLFPRLGGKPNTATDAIAGLQSDHRRANRLHNSIESIYLTWISGGKLAPEERERLLSQTGELRQLYAAHIQVEETIVFPYAAKVLDREIIAKIGAEFKMRRE